MDIICKAAAVADWRPKHPKDREKYQSPICLLTLEFEKTPDILARLGKTYGPGNGDGDGPYPDWIRGRNARYNRACEGQASSARMPTLSSPIESAANARHSAPMKIRVAIITEDDVQEYGPASKDRLSEEIWRVIAESNFETGESADLEKRPS